MTILTQRMREELVRRNYAETTIRTYLRSVEQFREYAQKRLDHLGPDDRRRYQAYLLENKKLAVGTVVLHIRALRCLYVKVLGRRNMKAGAALSETSQTPADHSESRGGGAPDRLGADPVSPRHADDAVLGGVAP